MTELDRLKDKCLIRIADDEEDVRRALSFMLDCEGWKTQCYGSAEEFLKEDAPSVPGCLILDVRMDGMSGIELQHEMIRRKITLPVIFLSGHGDIDMAVEAVQEGAVHFLQKPAAREKLFPAIEKAVNKSLETAPALIPETAVARQRLSLLTKRELEVMKLVAENLTNKQIAERLGISERTAEAHRFAAGKKLQVHSADEALRMMLTAEG